MDFAVNEKNKHSIGVHVQASGEIEFFCSGAPRRKKGICVECSDMLLISLMVSLAQ
jgi:hypothetical protein